MRVTKSFRKEDYKEGKKVIIYGAGRYGELAYWMLKELNIKPFCEELIFKTSKLQPQAA